VCFVSLDFLLSEILQMLTILVSAKFYVSYNFLQLINNKKCFPKLICRLSILSETHFPSRGFWTEVGKGLAEDGGRGGGILGTGCACGEGRLLGKGVQSPVLGLVTRILQTILILLSHIRLFDLICLNQIISLYFRLK
jgi:hypothetical protein